MSALANRRILVVEDEFVIAADLCEMLRAASAVALGPAASFREAMQLIQEHEAETAILNMNLNGRWNDPSAESLKTRGNPFVFTTGYGANERTEWLRIRTVSKAYAWQELEEQLSKALLETTAQRFDRIIQSGKPSRMTFFLLRESPTIVLSSIPEP